MTVLVINSWNFFLKKKSLKKLNYVALSQISGMELDLKSINHDWTHSRRKQPIAQDQREMSFKDGMISRKPKDVISRIYTIVHYMWLQICFRLCIPKSIDPKNIITDKNLGYPKFIFIYSCWLLYIHWLILGLDLVNCWNLQCWNIDFHNHKNRNHNHSQKLCKIRIQVSRAGRWEECRREHPTGLCPWGNQAREGTSIPKHYLQVSKQAGRQQQLILQ